MVRAVIAPYNGNAREHGEDGGAGAHESPAAGWWMATRESMAPWSMPDLPPGSTPDALPVTTIRAATGWAPLSLGELWSYRELVFFLVWSEIKIRYKQTALGVAWAVIQPLMTMVVFSVFFGRLADIPSDGVPYPIFAYSALVPWSYFAGALAQGSASLVKFKGVVSKVYFPRLIVPLASVLAGLVDFVIAFVVLLGMLLAYGILPSAAILTLPLFVLLAVATALAVALWLSALHAQYRDVGYAIPFLVQVWLFSTPIAYPSSLVPEPWRALYGLNPMAGVVEGFRWALLDKAPPSGPLLAVSVMAVVALLTGGLFYFRRMERRFADVL